MALVVKDRVRETTTTTGTGTVTLAGAVAGFQSFSVIGNGNTTYYTITNNVDWEVGIGTYTSSGTTLSRDTILESSNGGTAVNFGAGTKDVFVTYPAEKSISDGYGLLPVANGGTGATTAATARTNLGATTVGGNLFTLTNPSAITFPRFNADNTVSALDAATFRTAIGAGTSSTTGTVTSVSGTGTVSGLTLTGTVTTSGSLTLGGTLSVTPSNFASQTANTFLAAPNGVAGVPTFRAIVAADVPTLNQNTTGTAGNVTGTVAIANGGTGATTAATARTNLGATTVGGNLFTLTNPSAITFPRFNADNTVSALDAATFRTAIGAGTGSGTVTSVAASGGTTGLTFSGSPITTSGTLTLGGTLAVANGGTGATSLTSGYLVKGNGTSAVTASVVYDDGTNVGIGTASPGAALDVAGDAVRVTRAVSPAAFLGRQGNGTLASPTATVSGNQIVALAGSGHNGSAYTATPSAAMRYLALENFTATANGAAITFETTPIGSSTAARAERMRIDGSGNVGIGTSAPGTRLDVAGGSIRVGNTHAMTFRNAAGTGTATFTLQSDDNFVVYNAAGAPIQSFTQGATNSAIYGSNANNRMVVDSGTPVIYWTVNGSERMRITSAGDVGIGNTPSGAYKLEVTGAIYGSSMVLGAALPIASGGTGATTAATARTNLGLATVASSGSFTDLTNKPGIQSNGQAVVSTTSTLSAGTYAGTNILVTVGGITLTFPSTGYASGQGFAISNISGSSVTLSFPGGSDISTTLPNGASLFAFCDGGGFWRGYSYSVASPVALGDFTGANQSLATAGYQKFPGGLIMNWGSTSVAANTSTTASFSTSFPTACIAVGFGYNAGVNDGDNVAVNIFSTTAISLINGTGGTITIKWMAFGY